MSDIKILIDGQGLKYNGKINLLQASQILAFIGNDKAEPGLKQISPLANKPAISPGEILRTSQSKINAQRIAAFGKYLIDTNNTTSFNIKEVYELFRRSGHKAPKNLPRDLRHGVELNYFFEDSAQKEHYIMTDFGLEQVNKGFEKIKNNKSRKKSRKRVKSSINQKLISCEVSSQMQGMPNFSKLKKKGQKVLWLIYFADKKGVRPANPKDIEYLAEKLKENINTKNISALNQTNIKKGFVSVQGNGFSILNDGIKELEKYANA